MDDFCSVQIQSESPRFQLVHLPVDPVIWVVLVVSTRITVSSNIRDQSLKNIKHKTQSDLIQMSSSFKHILPQALPRTYSESADHCLFFYSVKTEIFISL